MDKKPLIVVSILAVILLVLGSLSNVVGYQSVKSTVSDSPLFITRTQRATNQQQNLLTSQYIGMGGGNPLQFPIKDNIIEQLKKAVDIISNMDDTTFDQFTVLCIKKVRQGNTLQGISVYQIIQVLLLLKTNPDAVINSYSNRNNKDGPTTLPTYCGTNTMCGNWYPGCWIGSIITTIILLFIINPIWIILDLLTIGSGCEKQS